MVVALLRISRVPPLRGLARLYIGFFRGVPVLVILYWIYFALPEMGYEFLVISSYTAAVLGLGIHGGAFLAEIFRSGIESLHRGQMEAALSLGMTPASAMIWIILPQALRVVVPPIANYAVGLLKETALCSIIAAPELMLRAKDLASSSFLPMHAFVLAAVFYYVMSFPLMRAAEYLEARMGRAMTDRVERHEGDRARRRRGRRHHRLLPAQGRPPGDADRASAWRRARVQPRQWRLRRDQPGGAVVGAGGAAQDAQEHGAAGRADPDPCRPDPEDVALGPRVPALLAAPRRPGTTPGTCCAWRSTASRR